MRLSGIAALDYGQRLFSRDLKNLKVGDGLLSTFLTAEGRVSESFWVIREQDGLLLLTPTARLKTLEALIEKYHFAEAFSLQEGETVFGSWRPVRESLASGSMNGPVFSGTWRNTEFSFDLSRSGDDTPKTADWLIHRIKNLIPEMGQDYDEKTLVFDIGFDELCDSGKGCYIGQEIVERVRTRGGQSSRKLCSIAWETAPEPEEMITIQNVPVGALTQSIAQDKGSFVSLAFVERKSAVTNSEVVGQKTQTRGRILRVVGSD